MMWHDQPMRGVLGESVTVTAGISCPAPLEDPPKKETAKGCSTAGYGHVTAFLSGRSLGAAEVGLSWAGVVTIFIFTAVSKETKIAPGESLGWSTKPPMLSCSDLELGREGSRPSYVMRAIKI